MNILYLCDGKACEECNSQCSHTTKINHAASFKHKTKNSYIEEEIKAEDTLAPGFFPGPVTIKVPNRDTYVGFATICTKEALQRAYVEKIGSDIDFCGVSKKVKDVRITDEFIFMDLE